MKKNWTLPSIIAIVSLVFFANFLFIPLIEVGRRAFFIDGILSFAALKQVVMETNFTLALQNSLFYAVITALLATFFGFLFAYSLFFTQVPKWLKATTHFILTLPMLLPTITYGFVIIYSFGKQGLWSQLTHRTWFSIYGSPGLFLGFLIYTIPITFILMSDGMKYLDTKMLVVSRLMRDSFWRGFYLTILYPLRKVFLIAFIQAFFMVFTDFGIPVALGGQKTLITTLLYEKFMGGLPDFAAGSVIALVMLLPSFISVYCLQRLKNEEGNQVNQEAVILRQNNSRDLFFGLFNLSSVFLISGVFLVLLIAPFVAAWPYDWHWSTQHLQNFLADPSLLRTLKNGLFVAFSTALLGTTLAYLTAVLVARTTKTSRLLLLLDSMASVTNSVPGMVLGISFLLVFSGTAIHNTFGILIFVNVVHFFATPYQMSKVALLKMNAHWEDTARLLGDRWFDTLWRILIPNSKTTLIEMFNYYFIQSMVTISGVVFLTSTKTMIMTTKMKELQHFGKFNDIFLLSILLLMINFTMRLVTQKMIRSVSKNEKSSIQKKNDGRFTRSRYVSRGMQSRIR
ncbi:ABC transporter permease subunit [Enterococcus lemanii]|uniref:ABC transporter permease subunit n=1 Tax=Enterococcus lemanii TaxID=1159752 RepID=A0ABV9MVR1_9ENTE|nr:ABC transporter permease subunit [Enterococcus lemanii]MBM7709088.1 iron(III) transport system permease protein [Enterococcus lemanii]